MSTREDQQRILSEIERDLRRGNRMIIAHLSLLRAREVLRRRSVGALLGVEAVLVIAALTAALAGWQRLLPQAVQAAVGRTADSRPVQFSLLRFSFQCGVARSGGTAASAPLRCHGA